MVLIGLLLVDVVCLVLGLVLASAGWLVGSLAASAAAAWVLWRGRDSLAGRRAEPSDTDGPTAESEPAASRVPVAVGAGASEADGSGAQDYARPDVHPGDSTDSEDLGDFGAGTWVDPGSYQPTSEAASDEMSDPTVAGVPAEPDASAGEPTIESGGPGLSDDVPVWVIDGRPNYHTAHCGVLLGANGEQIPHSQAVEDGFTPCTLCDPDSQPMEAGAFFATASAAETDDAGGTAHQEESASATVVWVVDGWPHYHDADCRVLAASGTAEAVPFAQAVDDGFTPCPACRSTAEDTPVERDEPVSIEPVVPPAAEEAEPEVEVESESDAEAEPEPVAADAAEVEPEPEPVAAKSVLAEPAAAEVGADETADAEAAEVAEADAEPGTDESDSAEEPADSAEGVEGAEDAVEPPPATPALTNLPRVWVVTGRPRYHLAECIIVAEQGPYSLAVDQAVEQGFKPCSLCEPPTL